MLRLSGVTSESAGVVESGSVITAAGPDNAILRAIKVE
jgi:hypothetical protein